LFVCSHKIALYGAEFYGEFYGENTYLVNKLIARHMVKIALLTTFSASVASCAVRVCQCLNTRIDALLAPIWLDREARKYVTCRCAELAGGQHVTAPLRHAVFRADGPHLTPAHPAQSAAMASNHKYLTRRPRLSSRPAQVHGGLSRYLIASYLLPAMAHCRLPC
jgi:hypothetical protein